MKHDRKPHNLLRILFYTDFGNRFILISFAVLIAWLWFSFAGFTVKWDDDTGTYLKAGDMIFCGHIDRLRTPIYPILCHIAVSALQFKGFYILVFVQLTAFFVSLFYFHKTASTFIRNRIWAFVATALYAWNIPTMEQTTIIHTESLSTSLTVWFIYLTTSVITGHGSRKICITAPIVLTLMILLRPFNMYFVPIMILAFIYAKYHKLPIWQKQTFYSFFFCILCLFSYCSLFKASYGSFSLSSVSEINRAYSILNNSAFDKGAIYPLADGDSIRHLRYWDIDYSHLSLQTADSIYHKNILKYATSRVTQFDISNDYYFPVQNNPLVYTYVLPIQCLKLRQIYLILLIIFICRFITFLHRKTMFAPTTMLLLMCFTTIFTTLWASAGFAFGRLMLPMFPCLCLLIPGVFDQYNIKLKKYHIIQVKR